MATLAQVASPYYSAYITAECKYISPAAVDYKPLSTDCQQINDLVNRINEPYTGNSNSERLAWLKRRRALLMQRAAIVAKALQELGSTDVVDHTALDVRTFSGMAAGIASALPGVGTLIGLGVGVVGQVLGGLFDSTNDNKAKRDEEISYYKADYAGLQAILLEINQEIDKLSVINYVLWGAILIMILIVLFKRQ